MKRKISMVLIMAMIINLVSAFIPVLPVAVVTGFAEDIDPNGIYVTPDGAGTEDGSGWENAMPGDAAGGLQAAWDNTPANGTLYIGSGTYTAVQRLNIDKTNDGIDENNLKRIIGVDTGEGKPRFVGRYKLGDVGTGTNQDKLFALNYFTATPVPTAVPTANVLVYGPGSQNDDTAIVKYTNAFNFAADVASDVLISNPDGAASVKILKDGGAAVTAVFDQSAYVEEKNAYSLTKMLGGNLQKAVNGGTVKYRFETVEAGLYHFSLQVVHGEGTADPGTGIISYDSVNTWETISNVFNFALTDAAPYTIPQGAIVLFNEDFQDASYQLVNVPSSNQAAAQAELAANGWTVNEATGAYGIARHGSNQFLKLAKIGTQNADIEKSFLQPIQINANPAPDGMTPLVSNNNGKLVIEYDFKIAADKSGRGIRFGLKADSALSAKSIAGLSYSSGTNLPLSYVRDGTSSLTLVPEFEQGIWYRLKQVINIKDADGNYVSTVDTYINDIPYRLGAGITSNVAASAAVAGRFYVNTDIYSPNISYSNSGFGVDNIRAYYIEEQSSAQTEAPLPTLKPTPTPTEAPGAVTTGEGASFIEISNLQIENYFYNIYASGKNKCLRFNNITSYNSSDVFYFHGASTAASPDGSEDIIVEDCTIYYNAKRGVRFRNGINGATVRNVFCDAGGQAYWATENWPTGFTVEGGGTLRDQNITFVDCVSQNNWHQAGANDYWNADGTAVEGGARNISYIRCYMYGSTDGGWDDKSDNPVWTDCVAMDNKRNFRIWSNNATMINCLSAYARNRGGMAGSGGIWTNGVVNVFNSTIYNNPGRQLDTDDGGKITATDCIIATAVGGSSSLYEAGDDIVTKRCIQYNNGVGTDPQINDPVMEYFYAPTNRFNSLIYGNAKGYFIDDGTPMPTPRPTIPPTPTPLPDEFGNITTVILNETFDEYQSIDEIMENGWFLTMSADEPPVPIPVLAVTAAPENNQYLKTAGAAFWKTFEPVPLKGAGGASPGKNAKIVLEIDALASGGSSGGTTGAFRFEQSSATTSSPTAIAYGRRVARGGRLDYSAGPGSSPSAYIISNAIVRFLKIKTEIRITDEYGDFFPEGPKVSIWCNGKPVLADLGLINSAAAYIDRFYVSGGFNMEVDNVTVKVVVNETAPQTHNITTVIDGGDGTITPGEYSVNNGEGKTFRIQPAANMAIEYVKVNGEDMPLTDILNYASGIYQCTVANVTADTTVNVGFYDTTPTATPEPTPTPEPTATPSPTPEPTATPVPDKGVLHDKISAANELYAYAYANIGTEDGQYDPIVVSALYSSITAAEEVYQDDEATGEDVIAAISSLEAAMAACVPNGSQGPETQRILLQDNFDEYSGGADLTNAGYTIDNTSRITMKTHTGGKYVSHYTNMRRNFEAVPLSAAAGSSPGKNAKLVMDFLPRDEITRASGGANDARSHWQLRNSATNSVLVSVGKRLDRDGYVYAASVGTSGGTVIEGFDPAKPIRYELKITDANGEFLANKTVDIYCDGVLLAEGLSLLASAGSVDQIFTGGGAQIAVDNLTVTLITDSEGGTSPTAEPTAEPTTEPTAEPTVEPTPEPTAVPDPIGEKTLLYDHFNDYTDLESMQAEGWAMSGTPMLAATDTPENLQYFRTAASSNAARTFEPVALTAAGGESPGKNAKLVISYDAFLSGGTGSSTAFWRVDDSETGSVAVSAGRRAGAGGYVRYAKSLGSSFSGLTISNGLTRFTKLKFVIRITDETGAFLATGPKVDVYCTDMQTPVFDGADRNMIDIGTSSVNRFYMGGAFNLEVDNLNITLVTSEDAATQTPVPVDKGELETTIGEAIALFATASENTGAQPGQYDPAVVAALSSAISSAQVVFGDPEATQEEVDAEVLLLEAAMADCVPNPVTETPEPTTDPTVEPTPEPTIEPTPAPDFITSSDEHIVVDSVTKKISYPHYKIGTANYHYLATIKSKLAAVSGYTYEIVESDGETLASGTVTEPMHKVIVSYEGSPVATYTFVATIQYGDVNGDGAITASDLGLLKKYLMNKTVNAFIKPYGIQAADINKQGSGSNTVTATDLGLLKRYLMSKTSYPISEPTVFAYDPMV